ncbi:IucA/IucC family protein [Rhizobium sp. 32-5/1]|uniref:IucA/IucC family protein n=1 Tax=Rhizobium sp. 32-5/1 TaxID=3019602 RepID=UPI00240D0789|nr:IucA/IucC family protein [Rhizobium sp. 32-5/1]WEZ82406.1 IucA/IucC family protein [Rhizobium sp. 32-5/1]
MRAPDEPWKPASLEALIADLPGPLVHRQRLLDELQQTIAFCRLNDEALTPRLRRQMSLAQLEGALEEGHPYHPCFKARTGFSASDHLSYGPEAGNAFQLVWLLVSRRHIRQALPQSEADFWLHELGPETWSQLQQKRDELRLNASDFGLIPLHPWQWENLRISLLSPWIEAGDAYFLGPMGDSYTATQSIRTLMNDSRPMAASIKLPMNLVNTSSRRILEPHSVCTAPVISEWIGGIVAQDHLFRSRYPMTILREYAGIIADAEGDLAGQVGAIWRQSAEATLLPGEAIVPLNALMMSEHDGRPFADDWIQAHGLMPWLNRLIEVIVLPVWHLLVCHGIAVEAHGQNMLLLHRDGWPVRLILRDFHESIEFSPSFLREPDLMPDFASLHPDYRDAPPDRFYWTDNLDSLRELVMDTLFVYNLSEISHLFEESYSLPESLFWQRVDACLASYVEDTGMAGRQSLLGHSNASILTESLMTRKLFAQQPEYHHLAPNPLAGHAAQLRRKP